jgi:hypothetical protein
MKKNLLVSAIIISIIIPAYFTVVQTAASQLPDPNAELKAEFKGDIPTSYGDAIKESLSSFTTTNTANDQVHIVYTGYAKLFGFLPVPVSVEVAVYPDGTTQVSLPWYRFILTHEDIPSMENTLSALVQSQTNLPSPDGVLSTDQQTMIVELLKQQLPLHFTQ